MSKDSGQKLYYVCASCANHLPIPEDRNQIIDCDRCGERSHRFKPRSIQSTIVFSLTALVLFFPANFFPFMTIEVYGNRNSSTIWGGVKSLVEDGSWPIGLIIFLASIVVPFVKLVILFYLSLTAHTHKHPKFKTRLYHIIEAIGRWSMLDIFLLAILVAVMKMGLGRAEPEVGALLFAGVVIFTMLASASFNPQLLWKEQYGNTDTEDSTKN